MADTIGLNAGHKERTKAGPNFSAIQSLLDDGLNDAAIERQLGLSHATVLRARRRGQVVGQNKHSNLQRETARKFDRTEMCRLLDAGLPQSEIAKRLGVTRAAINLEIMKRNGRMTKKNTQTAASPSGKRARRRDIPDLGARLRALFPNARPLAKHLGLALGRGHSSIEDILAGRNVPPEVEMIVELLEAVPRASWPMRWRILGE